ncbi:MAG TPA: hypothetical protein VG368_06965 [Acidimicrobiales bacterium]|jgi:hypothetical protein|nr:hypothetical protein [Acidimicrobiales bacterium]
MADQWVKMTAKDVQPGDRVRLESGEEVIASRVEMNFLGREGLLAFIEDTPDRWYKRPAPQDAPVEVLRAE